jgi:transcriptional regulator with XRE-family HTH domain
LRTAKKGCEKVREYLISLRKEKRLTQKKIADKLDISESYYSQIENGERQKRMDITFIDRLSKILDIPVQEIIRLENQIKEEN